MQSHPQLYKEERKILKESAFYSFSLCLRIFFGFIQGFLIAKFLDPALYGLRTTFNLVMEYEYYSHSGTFNAMQREVPYYRGQKDEERAKCIVTNVFGVNFLYALAVCATLLFVSLYLSKSNVKSIYVYFPFFLGLSIVTQKVIAFYTAKFITDKKVIFLSRIEIVYVLVKTIVYVTLVFYFGLIGLFGGLIIADVICILYILKNAGRPPRIQVSFHLLWGLLKIGFPIMIVGFLLMVFRNVDRTIILAMLSKEMLGYFGIAAFVSGIIYTIPEVIYSIFYPRLMEKLGRTKDIYRIKNYLIEPTVLVAYFMPFLLAGLYFSTHIPFQYFLTRYLPAINVAKILTLGLFFVPVFRMPLSVCIALNRQIAVIFLALPAILLKIILNYSFIRWGWGINGVAIGTGISYFVLSLLISWYALKQFNPEIQEILRFFLFIYAPFLYSLCLLLMLDHFLTFNADGFWNDLIFTSMKTGIFFVLFSLIFVFVRKHSAFIKLIGSLSVLQRIFSKLSSRWHSKF
jgi:O-antigen/teichoic acid export membrane protein